MLKSDKEVYKEFGDNLKKLRKQKNLTQTELANDLGMTQSAIYKYEKGLRKIPMSVLKQFASYFDLTLDELIDPNNELVVNEEPVKYEVNQERTPFINEDKKISAHYERWVNIIGYEHFTDEEIDQLIDYAQYLISKRK